MRLLAQNGAHHRAPPHGAQQLRAPPWHTCGTPNFGVHPKPASACTPGGRGRDRGPHAGAPRPPGRRGGQCLGGDPLQTPQFTGAPERGLPGSSLRSKALTQPPFLRTSRPQDPMMQADSGSSGGRPALSGTDVDHPRPGACGPRVAEAGPSEAPPCRVRPCVLTGPSLCPCPDLQVRLVCVTSVSAQSGPGTLGSCSASRLRTRPGPSIPDARRG